MIFKAITVPTPRRIRKIIKENATKERIGIYSLIGTGIGIVGLSDFPAKEFVIGTLVYYGVTYEVIVHSEDVINDPLFMEAYRKNFYINMGTSIRMF